jgi:RNA 2',3'-cyclic 3'-phosphodiesterase
MPGIRTFIALPTPSQVQQTIAGIQTTLKAAQADVKWESQDKFHITLVFLGNVDQSKLELLAAALQKSVQQFSSNSIIYESMGAFPNPTNPRIVWMGIRPNQIIQDLQSEIARVCARVGFPKEERLFHPHITLGRVKGPRNLVRLTDAIKTITFEPIETHCSEVLLMKSELRPGGSIYTRMKSFPLHT